MSEFGFCVDEELIAQAEAVVTAEPCTGGLIAAALSHAPGQATAFTGVSACFTEDSPDHVRRAVVQLCRLLVL